MAAIEIPDPLFRVDVRLRLTGDNALARLYEGGCLPPFPRPGVDLYEGLIKIQDITVFRAWFHDSYASVDPEERRNPEAPRGYQQPPIEWNGQLVHYASGMEEMERGVQEMFARKLAEVLGAGTA